MVPAITCDMSHQPCVSSRALGSQLWSQQWRGGNTKNRGKALSLTDDMETKLFWHSGGRQFVKSVPLDPKSIVSLSRSAPGAQQFSHVIRQDNQACNDDKYLLCLKACLTRHNQGPATHVHDPLEAVSPQLTNIHHTKQQSIATDTSSVLQANETYTANCGIVNQTTCRGHPRPHWISIKCNIFTDIRLVHLLCTRQVLDGLAQEGILNPQDKSRTPCHHAHSSSQSAPEGILNPQDQSRTPCHHATSSCQSAEQEGILRLQDQPSTPCHHATSSCHAAPIIIVWYGEPLGWPAQTQSSLINKISASTSASASDSASASASVYMVDPCNVEHQLINLDLVNSQKTTYAVETFKAKEMGEIFPGLQWISIKHSRFADIATSCQSATTTFTFCGVPVGVPAHSQNGWIEERTLEQQDHFIAHFIHIKASCQSATPEPTFTFCGVLAHYQNGLAEERTLDQQDHCKAPFHHAKTSSQPATFTKHLPCAPQFKYEMLGPALNKTTGMKTSQKSARSTDTTDLKLSQHVGSPAHIYENSL